MAVSILNFLTFLMLGTSETLILRENPSEPRPYSVENKVRLWNLLVFESLHSSCESLAQGRQKFQDKYKNGYCSILRQYCFDIDRDRTSHNCRVNLTAGMIYDLCCTNVGVWSEWTTSYGMCSRSCGQGHQYVTRTRRCISAEPCQGQSWFESARLCNTRPCTETVYGGWSQWRTLTEPCPVTCGKGNQNILRTRTCTNPSPEGGGLQCYGFPSETRSRPCDKRPCPRGKFACGQRGPTPRIVNGTIARQCEFPWMAAIQVGNSFDCGGVLIDRYHILTAAHCAKRTNMSVQVGKYYFDDARNTGMQVTNVARKQIHEDFGIDGTMLNDIALLTLSTPVEYNHCRKPICLPPANRRTAAGQRCIVAGWGYLRYNKASHPDQLMKVELTVYNSEDCRQRFFTSRSAVNHGVICAANGELGMKDSCTGDSGGPLICEFNGVWEVIGIVSTGNGCAVPKRAGYYAFVPYYMDWIRARLRN